MEIPIFKPSRFLDGIGSLKSLWLNKQLLAMLLFSSANAAVNPYKNIFGVDVIGLPEIYYSMVIFLSGLVVTVFSIYFGMKSDRDGSFVKHILICAAAGCIGSISLYLWPNGYTYLLATCLFLPVFCVLNTLIFGYSAAKRIAEPQGDDRHENASLRSAYSLGYVLTLGSIGLLTLGKQQLVFIWLIFGILSALVGVLYFRDNFADERYESTSATEPILQIFKKQNVMKLLGVSLITNMLFTLDATAPLIIINQAGGAYHSIGLFEAGIAVFEVAFIFFWSSVARTIKASSTIIAGAAIFSLAVLLFSLARSVYHAYLLIPVLAWGAACLISIPIGYLQSLAAHRPGVGASLLSISFFISSSVSSAIYFLGRYFYDTRGTIFISTGVGLMGLCMIFFLERKNTGAHA